MSILSSTRLNRKAHRYLSASLVTLFALSDICGSDEETLWLPVRYQTYYLNLKEAAAAAKALNRCETILSGTIDLDNTKKEQPIYRFLCREENGLTYNELVDGSTLETLTTKQEIPAVLTEEELAAQKFAQEQARLEAIENKKKGFWQSCMQEAKHKTRLMKGVVWLGESMPEPTIFKDNLATFSLDFDAESMDNELLHYTFDCRATAERTDISLRPRR